MIDKIIEQIVKDLGVNGLLLIGLYFAIGRFILQLTKTMANMNRTLIQIFSCMDNCKYNSLKKSEEFEQ